MFDTHIHKRGPQYVSVNTQEHRAPTDESVRLLAEMQKAALESIIARGHLQSNELNVDWVVHQDNWSRECTAICRFDLNGKEVRLKVPIKESDLRIDPTRVAHAVRDAVLKELATVIAYQLFENCMSDLRPTRRIA